MFLNVCARFIFEVPFWYSHDKAEKSSGKEMAGVSRTVYPKSRLLVLFTSIPNHYYKLLLRNIQPASIGSVNDIGYFVLEVNTILFPLIF